MKIRDTYPIGFLLLTASLLSGCGWIERAIPPDSSTTKSTTPSETRTAWFQHVPPGQSLSAAMAKRPQLVALPAPPEQTEVAVNTVNTAPQPTVLTGAYRMPDPQTEKVADAFTLGNLCLQQGRYSDAINAYEAALKDDPSFAEAWNNLAIAYQNSGQDDKAMAAFRKYKMVALH
jgi:tetratricopeptide (TPR) repeat protein